MQLLLGDCLVRLKELEDNSIDSIVTDPPYGISFMGKKWDYDVPQVEVWKEVLRVLKPGGHALVACGTRTQHRMAVNLEDAGFEIRDIVAWIYGSGFPKSLNIGKAVDKLQGNERKEYLSPIAKPDSDCWGIPNNNSTGEVKNPSAYNVKTENIAVRGGMRKHTKGTSEWEGWGTALKPAMELWTLCRKPLEEKTVAENCLKYGVGGINIDGCRVEVNPEIDDMLREVKRKPRETQTWEKGSGFKNEKNSLTGIPTTGRFPANLIHDGSEEVVERFPSPHGAGVKRDVPSGVDNNYMGRGKNSGIRIGDSGSAARFFYCAKASKGERNKGLEGFEKGCTHPTVKPVALMRYLCKLITPKGGVILDPYMGSGTTGIGAKLEGFNFIGIEMDKDYMEIAKARIDAWEKDPQLNML